MASKTERPTHPAYTPAVDVPFVVPQSIESETQPCVVWREALKKWAAAVRVTHAAEGVDPATTESEIAVLVAALLPVVNAEEEGAA